MENHLSNDRIISYHRNKLDYIESPENSLQFAFGDRRYEKMARQLVQETDILKLKILTEINEDFRRSDFINLALLSSDILEVLIKHFQDKSQNIRELASRSIVQVCSLNYGRDRIIEKAHIHNICSLIDDNVSQIRTNSYNAMLNLAEYRIGAEHILIAEKLPLFVDKLIEEKEESILIQVLQLIKKLLEGEGGTDIILQTEAIQRLTNHLEHRNQKVFFCFLEIQNNCIIFYLFLLKKKIRELSAINLACISFLETGKIKEMELNCVLPLCQKLEDQQSSVREAASICLASLAQKNQAKFQVIFFNLIILLFYKKDDPSLQTKLNIIQLIASISEHPVGRKIAHECLPKLEQLKEDKDNEYLVPYILQTVEVITWVP
ncbi:rtdr1-prov protein, putative [Ichthyophthirius multifiliis]|uniref:Rtdr1-prov protein, putative n=1 Tax=Ichthyophthirius multifiliis TaxID=5932 RepID=G0QYS2_ICHMU|nr:rtdr1-prov protein, putative [Ichthyophthirius multifiliis]EGR29633.1 rtdr1-prov protein, putative [Ichthyophthirius multifiliis]|eukprot:XP_004030869.1 rtdr1-prov protein, putative [Ichthyophthirius multifiliis]